MGHLIIPKMGEYNQCMTNVNMETHNSLVRGYPSTIDDQLHASHAVEFKVGQQSSGLNTSLNSFGKSSYKSDPTDKIPRKDWRSSAFQCSY